MSRFRLLASSCLVAGILLLPGVSLRDARSEEDPKKPDAEEMTPEDRRRAQRKHRQELEQRKGDLPKASKPALAILERFRSQELRLWSVPRARIERQGPAAVPALILMLEETDWEVRAFSAACLEDARAKEALRPLITAFGKEKFVEARRRMVSALGALKDPAAARSLMKAADGEDEGIVLSAVRGLGALGRQDDVPVLMKFVAHKNLDIRYEALGSLAALGSEEAIDRLVRSAKALVATRDLQRVDSPDSLDVGDRYEQYLLGISLARAETKAVEKLLGNIVQAEKPWSRKTFLRLGAAAGLGRRVAKGGSLHPALVKGLGHDDAPVRVACSHGAGYAGSPELLKPLRRVLKDSQLDVRVNVARALGQIGDAEAVKSLRKMQRDRSPSVRAAVAQALAEMPVPEATVPLLTALRDKKYVIRILAARALARRTAEPDVVEALTKAAKDSDYGVRAQALASLSQASTRPQDALPPLMDAIRDRDEGVQANSCLGVSTLLESTKEPVALPIDFVGRITDVAVKTNTERLRRAAVELLDAQRPPEAVPQLIELLKSKKEAERKRANSLLMRISESNQNYGADDPIGTREEAIRRWAAWWETKGELPRRDRLAGMVVTGALADQTRDLKWRGLDVALLLDSTGSMAGLLRAAKQSIDMIIAEMASPLPSLRISLFTYRDFGDNYVYYATPLTYDVEHLPGFLQSFIHGQGGDIPEAVHETVAAAMKKLEWRKDAHKVIIFAGDAPHHPEQDRQFQRTVKKWATPDNRAVLHAIFTDANRRSMDINRRKNREDPDEFDHPFFEVYKRIAGVGRGRGILLSDESALIKEILVLAFGPAWRADIENFLDFRN